MLSSSSDASESIIFHRLSYSFLSCCVFVVVSSTIYFKSNQKLIETGRLTTTLTFEEAIRETKKLFARSKVLKQNKLQFCFKIGQILLQLHWFVLDSTKLKKQHNNRVHECSQKTLRFSTTLRTAVQLNIMSNKFNSISMP